MFVFTSCTINYIPKARVLASSLKALHSDWTFCLLLGEEPPKGFILEKEPFDRLMTFAELKIPGDYKAWLFRHRVVEICTAAKGPALFHFLEREQHDKVMYLDPDIMVCNSLSPLETLLDIHDLLLTPHQLAPQETEQSIEDNELVALKFGVFNLGFVAAARRGDGLAFARWWRDRLLRYCYDDIPNGLFTDQRWCDLAPAFFPGLHVVRDAGCNAASWNLTDRTICRTPDGTFLANDTPLRFYHFTGFDSGAGDGMTARYAADMPAVHELWALYRKRLMTSGHAELGKQHWAYMNFDDGTPISDDMRLVYRRRKDVQKAFPNPFARPGYLDWYLAEHEQAAQFRLTRQHRKLGAIRRRARDELAQYGGFPCGLPGIFKKTLRWLEKWGLRGMLHKIWQSALDEAPPMEAIPLLDDLLSGKVSSAGVLQRLLSPSHSPVLIIEHDWGGGAASYCRDRVNVLLKQDRAIIQLRWSLQAERLEITVRFGHESLRCTARDPLELTSSRFPHIDLIIINELAGWHYRANDPTRTVAKVEQAVAAVTQIARHHTTRVEFLFHDYYPVCPTINLLDLNGRYCGLDRDIRYCDACALRGRPFSMARWRATWGELLALASRVVFFSENTRAAVGKVYLLRTEQIEVRPHEIKDFDTKPCIPADGPMRIAVVGDIQMHKGAEMVAALGRILGDRLPEASIVVFGNLETDHLPRNVMVLGPYERDDLPRLLEEHRITVGFFSSIWPETFSFVVHELALLNLPLVCFDLGAQGDYVRTLANSRVVSEVSAEAAFESLQALDEARKKKGMEDGIP